MPWVRLGAVIALAASGCLSKPPQPSDDPPSGRTCPPIGETPVYTTFPKVIVRGTFPLNYTFDEARMLAVANLPGQGLVYGAVDSAALQLLDIEVVGSDIIDQPALSPDGEELFVRRRVGATLEYAILHYNFDGSRWRPIGVVPIPIGGQDHFSVPTRAGEGRRLIVHAGGAAEEFREYEETNGLWQLIHTYSRTDLQVMSFSNVNITADGLRLVFAGSNSTVTRPKVMFADRPDLASLFGPARVMLELSGDVTFPFMTADCSRLYFVATPGLNYVEL